MATLGVRPGVRGVRTASRLIAGLALAMLAALGSPFPAETNAADAGTVAAAELVAAAAEGQPVELDGAMIVGDLDLSSIETISRIFRCTRCTFNGSIASSNVIFERLVDLSGADVAGAVDFGGAIFRDAFLMRAVGERPTRVVGPVSFSLATFGSRANFEGAQFGSDVDFRVTQFGGDATFADASIAGDARFDSASFAGRTQFNSSQNATFGGLAAFTTATFQQKADFRQRAFLGDTTFAGAGFESADFTLTAFSGKATFDDASVDGTAAFRVAQFFDDLSFQRVVLRGPTDFQAAAIFGEADFSDTSASDRFVLTGLSPGASITFANVTAPSLEMNLDLLDDVDGQLVQIEVLSMIEAGARERGDLELANDAAFRRSQLEADRADGVDQMIRLSGEAFGGYLVQPFYPIRAMLILIIIGTVVRWIARLTPQLSRHSLVWDLSPALATADATAPVPVASRGVDEPELPRGAAAHDQLLWLSKALATGARALADTIRAAVRLRPRDIPEQRRDDLAAYATAFLAGGEWLAYKVLFALFIIGLANANPTFKQLVEAVR